ncbi:TPA: hypothetical protein ACGNDM_000225 [Streptococcus agalactiae]
MKLEDFQTYPFKSLQEYISDKDRAVKFSFLLQGDEPDRSELTKLIYSEIFEWYNENEHSGDTLITYRTAIFRKYYGKSYRNLSRDKQNEILNVIKSYTHCDEDFPFEFELEDKENPVYQICNNYQIGNFGIFPKGRINPKRAQSPYNDYFDLALSVIWELYDGTLTPDDEFKKAILDEKEYFNQFEDFETFLSENFLTVPTSEELAYEALKIAEEEVDKIFKLDEHFNQKNSNLSQLKLEFTKKKIYGGFVILLLIIFLIFSNSEILFFAWILSIILYLSDKVRIFKEKIKYNKLIRENQKEHTEEKKKLLSTLRKEYFSIPTEFRKHNHISRIRYYLNANIASNLEQAIHYYSNEYNTKMMEEQIYNLHHSNKILQDRVTELELEKERRELDRY